MEQKKSEFNKVLNAWDVLVIAFGAMIGWGWVVSTGGWIEKGGVLGAAIGFVIGGIMIFFVGILLILFVVLGKSEGNPIQQPCLSAVASMYSATRQWVRQVHSYVRG